LSDSPPSLRYGGHQPSLKLRLASRSFSEGWLLKVIGQSDMTLFGVTDALEL